MKNIAISKEAFDELAAAFKEKKCQRGDAVAIIRCAYPSGIIIATVRTWSAETPTKPASNAVPPTGDLVETLLQIGSHETPTRDRTDIINDNCL